MAFWSIEMLQFFSQRGHHPCVFETIVVRNAFRKTTMLLFNVVFDTDSNKYAHKNVKKKKKNKRTQWNILAKLDYVRRIYAIGKSLPEVEEFDLFEKQ